MSDAESFDLNNRSRAADATSALPTSSSEVEVRTMASDFEIMGKSGGMLGQTGPQSIQVPVTLHPEEIIRPQPSSLIQHQQPVAAVPEEVVPPARSHLKIVLITTVVTLGIAGLLALGYFFVGR